MKKMFIIFFLVLLLFPVMAYSYESNMTVKTTVSRITLSQAVLSGEGSLGLYRLYGGLDSADTVNIDSLVVDDISQNDIVVYFRIAQLAKTRTDETISLIVEADGMINVEPSVSRDKDLLFSTEAPVISDVTCLRTENVSVDYLPMRENDISFTLSYTLGKPVENVNLAYFKVTWKKTEGLAPGLYTSDITLSYIVN